MSAKFENVFTVQAPVEAVWACVTDRARVASVLPGAMLESLDPATRTVEISANGGEADVTMTVRIVEATPGESQVTLGADAGGSDPVLKRFAGALRAELEKPPAFVDADAEQAEMAAAVRDATDTSKTLPPTGLEGLPPLPPPEGPETLPVTDAPVVARIRNPAETNPLPAMSAPPPKPQPAAVPVEVVPSASGSTVSRALKKPITWVLVFMVLVLLAALLS